jgi:hypothetical protein
MDLHVIMGVLFAFLSELLVGLQNINDTNSFYKVVSKFQFSHICFLSFRRHKIQFGTHWGNVGGYVCEERWKEHITAARTRGHVVICCFEKNSCGSK